MSKKLILTPNAYKASKVYAVKPINGKGDFDFIRNTGRTRINVNGQIEELSNNIVALDYQNGCPEILLEPQRTNLYLNSDVLSTQDVSTNAQSYAVSFEGTGTIDFSGSYTGSLTGNGSDRVSLVFLATSGTLTSTVTGDVFNAQIENVQLSANAIGESTTIIPTTTASKTRNKDILSKDLTPIINSTYTMLLEVYANDSRIKIEDNITGIDLPLTGKGKIGIQVDTDIKIFFPDNGQPQTILTYEKPSDFRDLEFISKLAATRIGVVAIENGIQDVSNWISGNVSSYFIETDWSLEIDLEKEFSQKELNYFPVIDLSNSTNFKDTFFNNNFKTFPDSDLSSGINFSATWNNNKLKSFRANVFDNNNTGFYFRCFRRNDLDQESVDNILISINNSAQANNITNGDLGIDLGTNATPSQAGKDAADALRANGWTLELNGY